MTRRLNWLFLWATLLYYGTALSVAWACESVQCTCHKVSHEQRQGIWLASTDSFKVCSFRSAAEAKQVAQCCEELRSELSDRYDFATNKSKWQPKCEVYLFSNKNKYGAVVGRAAMETVGSSLVIPETGTIKNRRIDLRTDVSDYIREVLPHELTHVMIADHFRDGPPPLWYDEGLALLSDSQSKQSLHLRDLQNGIKCHNVLPLQELLTASQYPGADRMSVFYGQCASVARYLSHQRGNRKIHQFARRSQEVGVNLALKESYGIGGVAELERTWRANIPTPSKTIPAQYSFSP